ncbi:DUF4363 domain-containing protein [Tychonema sp. LEGE 07199]|uniref:DUF4363 domain-containing protein n=1 Tax=unclassified Tychonema TaxID=2642144 RepID=UPI001882536F|nr:MULTISPECIES: DUF4363 domain-containing protein [unclassified Tychonema]MBE9123116.1 DUF4363 domain-containing protein [Tychonema sp. LEGE 07199]MBE9132137.1 DUF4363 domain-containing protein [Tychonema sp. LEGE 07196]
MARFNQILVLSAVTLVALAGCGEKQEASTPPTSPPPVTSTTTTVTTSEKPASTANYPELMSVVTNTKAAVDAGDFVKAKTEFDKFETSWKKVEDGIKAKEPKSYDTVEQTTEKVTDELKKGKPSKDLVLAQLQSLEKTIASIPKS